MDSFSHASDLNYTIRFVPLHPPPPVLTNDITVRLTLSRPMPELAAAIAAPEIDPETGDPLPLRADLAPGCDLRAATCAAKFGNLPNFGGFPEIPGRNPFGGGSIV